jgi:L-lactate dehydrogenase
MEVTVENELREKLARRPTKVSIVGSGMVGASLAYTLIVERVAGKVVLIDINKDRARGEAMDIRHALPFSMPTKVVDGDYPDCLGSDVIVITAGAAQKPGERRLDLAERNYNIYREIIPRLVDAAADAIILIVSNPVDVLTYATLRISGLPWQRIIGSGTVLDTARFRYELSSNCQIDPRSVHAYIIGEHGDSEVPVWSAANIAGVHFQGFCEICGRSCSSQKLDAIFDGVKNAAYEIVRLKGATYFAIALGVSRMIQAILRDQNTVLTASTLLKGQYGIRDVCLSLPIVLGACGVRMIIEMPIAPDEQRALHRSAGVLREVLDRLGL